MKKTISVLSKKEIDKVLKQRSLWSVNAKGTHIVRTLSFENHVEALVFVARVTVHAQVLEHHPEIVFTFKKVKISLTTHEAKGLTKKDFELASRIDSLHIGG